ncbi:hypothetical protein [Bosea minatitlanensis]|uniref:Uncharacterized protein n=1 Tax=Bosea minatitlanensis TaxID=128782 RepID=A0ABW0F2S2_9HYPH|nr:hypothetical protein [Bosea minatitlanensis]MCT4492733.1 hypothetical protein [Bosea minatitlanensis]
MSVDLPNYSGEKFVSLFVTEHGETSEGIVPPPQGVPATLFSVRARTTDGPAYVLTDHGTRHDADAAAKLLSGLTGLPVET